MGYHLFLGGSITANCNSIPFVDSIRISRTGLERFGEDRSDRSTIAGPILPLESPRELP